MKIVYLASSVIPSRTANSIHVMKMCQAFAKNGHDVTLVVPNKRRSFEPGIEDIFTFYDVEKNFSILRTPWPRFLPLGRAYISAAIAAWHAHRLNADLVYARDVPACIAAAATGIKSIFEIHWAATDADRLSRLFYPLLFTLANLKRVVVITQALADWYATHYPHLKNKLMVAPDGADPMVQPLPVKAQKEQEPLTHVGYVGHLYEGKGMEVIAQISPLLPAMDFHIVGGTERDIAFWKQQLAHEENVHLHGHKPNREAMNCLAQFDVVLAPLQTTIKIAAGGNANIAKWTSPLKIFEYMAAGKAIIASDLPVLREVLRDGENCLLCPPDDPEAWVSALIRLRDHPDLRKKLGRQAQAEFLDRYTWAARAEKVLAGL